MALADWLRASRALHERANKGELKDRDAEEHRAACDELARALIAAQRLTLKPGEVPRHALRVARALQVDLETPVTHVRGMTLDLSVGGFSVLLAKAPPSEEHTATLRLPGAAEPIRTTVLVADVKQQAGNVRASFAFTKLSDEGRARLELLVIDTALSQLAS